MYHRQEGLSIKGQEHVLNAMRITIEAENRAQRL